MANADQGMGGGVAGGNAGPNGHQSPGKPGGEMTEADLASKTMGTWKEQGTDPDRLSNTRETMPDEKQSADDSPTESARKLDKDVRAEAELGKGNRYGEDHAKNDAANENAPELSDPPLHKDGLVGKSL